MISVAKVKGKICLG